MQAMSPLDHTRRRVRRRHSLHLLLVPLLAAAGNGAEPLEPLPAPYYSFDIQSPSVAAGFVAASDVLMLDFPHPLAAVPGFALGLALPGDDLDGLSGGNAFVTPLETFALLFSVDRQTVGAVPPDPELIALAVPYNVLDQAQRGHAAGDQYMSTALFMRLGGSDGDAPNNTLVRNNYDEGGTSFSADPPTRAHGRTGPVPQDNVGGTAQTAGLDQPDPVTNLYFSATAKSPSLPNLPGGAMPSGAHIFFNEEPGITPTTLYAAFADLRLVQADEIDAQIVFDFNKNGVFDGSDQVLFSLAPDSPSLLTIPGASPQGAAADVFVATAGQPPKLFASAAELGLGHPQDNIDALEYLLCTDPYECAARHGIRALKGDLNCDDQVDFDDIDPFVLALSGQAAYQAAYPDCYWLSADCNFDRQVNFDDIDPFVALLGP